MFRLSSLILVSCTAFVRAQTDNQKLDAYNAKTTTPTTVLEIGVGEGHLKPDLWSNTHAIKVSKKADVVYQWRKVASSSGENIQTMEDKKAGKGKATHIVQNHYIVTGTKGEEWSPGDLAGLQDKYVNIQTTATNKGTCTPKPDVRRAVKMNHPFKVWVAWDKKNAQVGQKGYYLVQYKQGKADYGPLDPTAFASSYDRVTAHKGYGNALNWEEEWMDDYEYEEYLDELIDEYEQEIEALESLKRAQRRSARGGRRRYSRHY